MNICRDGLEGGHKSFNPDMVPCEYDMLQKTYFKAVQSYFGNITEGENILRLKKIIMLRGWLLLTAAVNL